MRKEIPARIELTCDVCSKIYDSVEHEHFTVTVKVYSTKHYYMIDKIVDLCCDCGENFMFPEWAEDLFGIKSGRAKFINDIKG